MGIGDAYLGLVDLLSRNGKSMLKWIKFWTDDSRIYHGRIIEARVHHRVCGRVCHFVRKAYQYG